MTTQRQREQGQELGRKLGVRWDRVAFTPEQLAVGAHHELEHTRSLVTAARIALDHLRERPDYYKKLEQCLPERKTRKRNVPVPEELKQDVWYHGTPSDGAAKGILAKGLKPGHQRAWAYGLEPARGAVYLTRDQREAVAYAGGVMGGDEEGRYGYVFAFPASALSDVLPDEDYVGLAGWAAIGAPGSRLADSKSTQEAERLRRDQPALLLQLKDYIESYVPEHAQASMARGGFLAQIAKDYMLPNLPKKVATALLVQGAPALFRGPPLQPTAAWRFQRAWTKKETNEIAGEGTTPEELRDYFRSELLSGRTLRQVNAEKIL